MPTTEAPIIPKRQAWRALTALCIGLFTTMVDQSLVAVAIPHIREDLDASVNQVVWVSAIYLLMFAAPLLVTGRLGDRFGQRNIYAIGLALFVASALTCFFAPTIEMLIVVRAVQGLGASLMNPQPFSVINQIFPKHRRGAAMGVWSAVAGSSGLIGPVLGGVIVGTAGWRWVFLLYVPLGLLALVMTLRWVPKLPTAVARIDLTSVVISIVAVFAVVFTLQQGPETGWPVWIWGVLALGLIAAVVFVLLQRRASRLQLPALMPLELFSIRNFTLGAISVTTLGFTVYSIQLPIMLHLQSGAGLSSQLAGLLIMPMAIVSISLAPIVGRLADKLRPGIVSMIGFSSLITAMVLFASLMRPGIAPWWLLIPIVLLGASNALCWSSNSTISMRGLPRHLIGAGSGFYNTARQVGAAIGSASLGAVMQVGAQTTDISSAMGNAMLLPIGVLLIGLIAVSQFRSDLPDLAPAQN
ncbi:DHA2 family efflux MFS transporter permease subunit [Gulosibacter chungangensis]|uniref:DHA2 family efflux MFS transporter permease subunit n=1 Tax=Gulosibacter chungangensis TaxID=979746 RepID=A0A7J5BBB9_9MICO|nr:DHA2 family efflux MFS transporter permease subunit [Gulosibacter chungangensis]KAB1643397.1 DHA2 family efflux MFS transporter permease subunit [Gulosibacter chungangensis]